MVLRAMRSTLLGAAAVLVLAPDVSATVDPVRSLTAPSARTTAAAPPAFAVHVSGPLTRSDVPYSWRPGCPVAPSALRRMSLSYWGFDGAVHTGALVVSARSVPAVRAMFAAAFAAKFRIRRMIPVDAYYSRGRVSPARSDIRSMDADNTSGFNCRWRGGVCCTWSQHAYGRAIDLNPVENPYLWSGGVSPPAGRAYRDRSQHRPGMVHVHDRVWWAFHAVGWGWGGTWSGEKDYQHFSANGR